MKEAIIIITVMWVAFLSGMAVVFIQDKNDMERKRVNIEAHKMIDELCNGRGGSYDGKNLNCY